MYASRATFYFMVARLCAHGIAFWCGQFVVPQVWVEIEGGAKLGLRGGTEIRRTSLISGDTILTWTTVAVH